MIKKIIEKIFLGNKPNEVSTDGHITRQKLLDEVHDHFIMRFEEETTTESMLFPTSFYIYLHEKDYQKQEQTFFRTAEDVAKKNRKILGGKLNDYPDYVPHSTYWLFQFCKYTDGSILDDSTDSVSSVQIGEPIIVSTIFAMDLSKNNISNESNIKATTRHKGSDNMENLNINMDAFLGMEIDSKDRIRIDFNKNFNITSVLNDNNQAKSENAFATLKCDAYFLNEHRRVRTKYLMTTNLIEISGKNDTRRNGRILRIDSDKINDSHLHIKFLPNEKQFRLAAFGEGVILNERKIEKSIGAKISWYNLPNNSSVFINGEVQIDFTINK